MLTLVPCCPRPRPALPPRRRSAAPGAPAAAPARPAATGRVRGEVVRHAKVHVVGGRGVGRHVMEVAARAVEIRDRNEPQQRQRGRVDPRARESGCPPTAGRSPDRRAAVEIDEKSPRRIARRRDRRILIEQIAAPVAGVVGREIRPPIAVVESGEPHRPADGEPETLSGVRSLLRGWSGLQLVGRAVERRAAERVVRLDVVRVLPAAASSEGEVAASASGTAWSSASARTARSAASTLAAKPPPAKSPAARTESLAELAGRRIELPAADRLETIVHHAAIEARHVAVDGHGFGRPFRGEPRRQQQPRGRVSRFHGFDACGGSRLRLHRQRLKALRPGGRLRQRAATALGGPRRIRCSGSRRHRHARRERELKVDGLIAGRGRDRDGSGDRSEAREIRGDLIAAGRQRDMIGAIGIG